MTSFTELSWRARDKADQAISRHDLEDARRWLEIAAIAERADRPSDLEVLTQIEQRLAAIYDLMEMHATTGPSVLSRRERGDAS